jgi:hypothetical protein
MTEDSSQSLAPVTVPLLGSLVLTGGVVWLSCRPSLLPSLTWKGLFASALIYVLIAVATHVFAIWSVCSIFREQIEVPLGALIYGLWFSAAWLPLLALLIKEHSVWTAVVPPLISAPAALFLKRWKSGADSQTPVPFDATDTASLFRIQEPPSFLRTVLPVALISVAFQAGAGVLLLGYSLRAGLLFAICTMALIWAFPMKLQSDGGNRMVRISVRSLIRDSLIVVLLTGIALIPLLKHSRFAVGLNAFLRTRTNASTSPPSKVDARILVPGEDYSGVILVLPPKSHEKIVPPTSANHAQISSVLAKPVTIPFDGVYWYFKRPDRRPRADAPTVRGDPTKANIHSTDFQPLSMEAHQHLGNPIKMDCCNTIRLAIQNADDRPGAIYMEILLKDTTAKGSSAQSLGSLVVPSSEDRHMSLNRPAVQEVLSFSLPPDAHGKQFDEITVVIKPSRERARAGAHIAIQHFELVP